MSHQTPALCLLSRARRAAEAGVEARIGAVTSELFEGRFGEQLGLHASFAEELEGSGIICCLGFCFYFVLY